MFICLLQLFGYKGPGIRFHNGVDGDDLFIGELIKEIIDIGALDGFIYDLACGTQAGKYQ